MFPSKQQEWYSASTMEYPWLQSQVHSFSPTLHFPSFLHPLDDSKSHNINLHHMSLSHSNNTNSNNNNYQEEDRGAVVLEKKLNHNASERDRRRKLNALYSSLRALLPLSDQKVCAFKPNLKYRIKIRFCNLEMDIWILKKPFWSAEEAEHSYDGSESSEIHTRAEARTSTFVSEKRRALEEDLEKNSPRAAEKQSNDGLNRFFFLSTDRSKLAHWHRDCCPDCYVEMDICFRHVA